MSCLQLVMTPGYMVPEYNQAYLNVVGPRGVSEPKEWNAVNSLFQGE